MHLLRPVIGVVIAVAVFATACGSSGSSDGDDTVGPNTEDLVLTENGIGPYLFGQPFDTVRAGISDVIGGWDVDSFDQPESVYVPTCSGPATRLVSWGNLTALFTGETDDLVFVTWTYGFDPLTGSGGDIRSLNLATGQGIGLGASRATIENAYGDTAVFTGDAVVIGATSAPYLQGRMEADALVLIESAPACTV